MEILPPILGQIAGKSDMAKWKAVIETAGIPRQ